MNVKFYKIIYFILPVMTLLGCKKYVESGNVNVNPNQPSSVTLNTLLPAVEDATATNHCLVAYTTSLFSQQMAAYQSGSIDDDQNRQVRIASAYYGLYQTGLTNSKLLIDMAKTLGAPHYSAMGRILFVLNLALAADTFGDIPFSDAFQAPAVLYPHYDAQQGLYTLMQSYLDTAILETQQATPAALKPASDDLIYGGDTSLWRQTAYFLKAKLYMHTTKKGSIVAANNALAALANAYKSTSKDLQLVYDGKKQNPWFINVSGRIVGAVFTNAPSKRFIDALNGNAYPGLTDPRLTVLVDKGTAASYIGIPNGTGATGNTANLTLNTFYGKSTSPLLMASYAEQKLMEAEARFISNGGLVSSTGSTQAAYDAYLAGITANFAKLGVDGTAYLANPLVAVKLTGLTLELIMRERQVLLFLNPEAWVDVRRYDYNPLIFKGMALPANQDAGMTGLFIRRSGLPLDEINRNINAKAADKPLFEKVWWDQ